MMESAPLECLKSCLPTLQPLSSRPRSSFGFSDIYRCECVCVCVLRRRTGCGGGKDREADAAIENTDYHGHVSARALWVCLPVFSIAEYMFYHLTDIRRRTSSCFLQTAQRAPRAGMASERAKSVGDCFLFWAGQWQIRMQVIKKKPWSVIWQAKV